MEFLNPHYMSEAFELLDKRGPELKIAAGMTHLLRVYDDFPRGLNPRVKGILHIGDLQGLSECREENQRYALGATATLADVAKDSYLGRYVPAIVEAAESSSTPQTRNRRTVGGELGWGSFHSPLIVTLMALNAKIRLRFRGDLDKGIGGREENMEIMEFYDGVLERSLRESGTLRTRAAKSLGQHLILKAMLPHEALHGAGAFSFFRGLRPKASMENAGVVLAVHGFSHQGVIQSARLVASGRWMETCETLLPLEGVRLHDSYLFEKLYSFCDRFSFDKFRREGPSGSQLGLVVFGLLKEGFGNLAGRP